MPRTWFATASSIAVLFCVSSGNAFADFGVRGSTSGTFYLGKVALGSSLDLLGLSFAGTDFGPTTIDTDSPKSQTNLNLGTFNLSSLLGIFNPFDFSLKIKFSAPAGVGSANFKADLKGAVVLGVGGSAKIDFVNNGPRHFDFTSSQGSGSFDLAIADVTLTNGSSKSVKGIVSNATFAATPEPTSIILMSTLMGGMLLLFRKRLVGR